MPNWNPNSNKHKATHGGYKSKPSRRSVNANLDFWMGIDQMAKSIDDSVKLKDGAQLKLDL
jgi:hypothetical protein